MFFLFLFFILAGVYSYAWSLLNLPSLYYWFLYVPLGIISSFITIFLILLFLFYLFKLLRHDSKFAHFLCRLVVSFTTVLTRTRFRVIGREKLGNENFVVFANHKSYLDGSVLYLSLKKPCAAVVKKRVRSVPFIGTYLNSFKCLFIDRDDNREGIKTILEGIKLVKDGYSMAIFPEGGIINREDEFIRQYKSGAFNLALKAKANILPVSIIGGLSFEKKKIFKRKKMLVVVHDFIRYEDYKGLNTNEIAKMTSDIINKGVYDYSNLIYKGKKKNINTNLDMLGEH